MILDYETCIAAASTFSVRKDFRKHSNSAYQWLQRNGFIEPACSHMLEIRRNLTDEQIASIASNFAHRRAFKLADQSAYAAANKRGIIEKVCSHMTLVRRALTNGDVSEIASKYSSRSEFVRCDNGAYQSAIKRGILDHVCEHMEGKGTRRLTNDELLEIAATFRTRNDFKLGDFGAYTTTIRRGIIELACDHMEIGSTGFRPDLPAVLYQFSIKLEDGLVIYKVGITNRKPSQRAITMGIRRGVKAVLTDSIKFEFGRDARIAEKRLHRKFAAQKYVGDPVMKNGNTELFTVNIMSTI